MAKRIVYEMSDIYEGVSGHIVLIIRLAFRFQFYLRRGVRFQDLIFGITQR